MSDNYKRSSEMREIKRQYLKRAFEEGTGKEAIRRLSKLNDNFKECMRGIDKTIVSLKVFEAENRGQPRAVKGFNLLAELEGRDDRIRDSSIPLPSQEMH